MGKELFFIMIVTTWIPVRIPHKVNAKINLFSRKRDVEGAVPYRHETNFVRTFYPVYTMIGVYVYQTHLESVGAIHESPVNQSMAFCYRIDTLDVP